MSHGGIFGEPTALGIPLSGFGALDVPKCDFSRYSATEMAKTLQQALQNMGATSLKVDGVWGSCSESAYQKIMGTALTRESLEKMLGVTCGSFSKTGSPSPSGCTNGTDAIKAPPQQNPPWDTPAILDNPPDVQVPPTPIAPPASTPPTVFVAPASKEWIPGVPNWATVAGTVLVLSVAGAAIYKSRKR